jgi:hypothetical protein
VNKDQSMTALSSIQRRAVNTHLLSLGIGWTASATKDEDHDEHTFLAIYDPCGRFVGEEIVLADGRFDN